MELDYYLCAVLQNNEILSRSIGKGIINRTTSQQKPMPLIVDSEKIKILLKENSINCVRYLYSIKENKFNVYDVKKLIRDIFSILNSGIYEDNVYFRNYEISREKSYGLPLNVLEKEFDIFCNWYLQVLNDIGEDIEIVCAICERVFDKVHFLADSSGRVSRLLSTFLCMRFNSKVKLHKDSKVMYDMMRNVDEGNNKYTYSNSISYITYYKSLPNV